MSKAEQCMSCDTKIRERPVLPLKESYCTLSGDTRRIVLCFPCRRLAVPFEGSDRCDGRCGGHNDNPTAWHAECSTCPTAEVDDEGDPLPTEWSCWEEGCVRAWAAEHDGHVVEIIEPWKVSA